MVASANLWVKFFQAAGVPSSTAATYAHIFCENRMELDMLMDLNKEYLREMGISPMGDIIAILRHAKRVSEQNAREKVLNAEKQSVVTLSVSPLVSSPSVVRTGSPIPTPKIVSEVASAKPARRVLPEHEGRYKIKLPSGTTERSKQILAKRATLTDKHDTKKKGIFDRLEREKGSPDQTVQMTTGLVGKSISSSIFSRLGGKSETEEEIDAAFAGIFKSAPKKLEGVKKVVTKQKVILVKKIPAKAATMIADDYVNSQRMETGEKSVSFSTEDEILEIESRKTIPRPNKNRSNANNNIHARLGSVSPHSKQPNSSSISSLHRTQKVIKLKQPVKRANGSPIKTAGLKSDQTAKSVKSRLSLKGALGDKPEVNKLVNRIGRVSLSSRLGRNSVDTANGKKSKPKAGSPSSVFNRLGFNKK